MTIYRSVLEKIDYELNHREELMKKEGINDDRLYYAYMVGRMEPIINWLLESENVTIAD